MENTTTSSLPFYKTRKFWLSIITLEIFVGLIFFATNLSATESLENMIISLGFSLGAGIFILFGYEFAGNTGLFSGLFIFAAIILMTVYSTAQSKGPVFWKPFIASLLILFGLLSGIVLGGSFA